MMHGRWGAQCGWMYIVNCREASIPVIRRQVNTRSTLEMHTLKDCIEETDVWRSSCTSLPFVKLLTGYVKSSYSSMRIL